jgi:uncharacterized protein involved in exopolysaccharide biosynthesis
MKSMDLEARYSASHPLVLATNDQLKEAQKVLTEQAELRKETTDDINPIHRELSLTMKQEQSVVEGLKARLAELDRQTTTVLADLRALNQQDLKIDQLSRDAELARSKYMQYALTMEEARVDTELQNKGVSNLSVLQPATLTEKPVTPSRNLTVAGTFLLAVFATLGLVLHGEGPNQPAPPVSPSQTTKRRMLRRAVSRKLVPKTNGHSEDRELQSLPK